MESPTTTTSYSVVSEFEGTLLKNQDPFSYFMLVAYEVSGLIRFTIMLFLYPVLALLDVFGYKNAALKLMIFLATTGVHESEIELVARAVLPKFYMDDVCMDTWKVLSSRNKNKVVVVTRMPRVMVNMFAKEHLGADEVIGTELIVNQFGFLTGLIRETNIDQSLLDRVAKMFFDQRPPHLGLGRPATTFLSLCEEQIHAPVNWNHNDQQQQLEVQPPKPVVFYDGRFGKRPTPATALLILLWFPFGIVLAVIRLFLTFILPIWALRQVFPMLGIRITLKGKPPQPRAARNSSLLFVGNHRTMIDNVLMFCALGHSMTTITFTASGLPNFLSPTPLLRISRIRDIDAEKMKKALSKGDLLIFPEAVPVRSPFLVRFSALFAELTDEIVPVAMNNKAGFFHNTVRNLGPRNFVFMCMNPTLDYEVTFLDQLPIEATCASGKDLYDVANHVQRVLADTLGFKCTNFTKNDMLKLLI